jgi:hypothetical protein
LAADVGAIVRAFWGVVGRGSACRSLRASPFIHPTRARNSLLSLSLKLVVVINVLTALCYSHLDDGGVLMGGTCSDRIGIYHTGVSVTSIIFAISIVQVRACAHRLVYDSLCAAPPSHHLTFALAIAPQLIIDVCLMPLRILNLVPGMHDGMRVAPPRRTGGLWCAVRNLTPGVSQKTTRASGRSELRCTSRQ